MINYIVYKLDGKILRTGVCLKEDLAKMTTATETAIAGVANGITQKVVDGLVVDKTPQEIIDDNPPKPVIPHEQQPASITNEQYQNILKRLENLE